jgi:hypothetical protein
VAVVARPDPSMGGPAGGSGAYAIRALPDLSLGIGIGASRRLDDSLSIWLLKPRDQPRGFLCPSAVFGAAPSTEPSASSAALDQLVTTRPESALWQVPARRFA